MRFFVLSRFAAVVLASALLGACGPNSATTTTPTSTLGTDSAATKVGGMPADSTTLGQPGAVK